MRHCFAFFSCALLVTKCCCLYHLSADDETSNVLKRSVKNVRSRFGSLLYIKIKSKISNLHYTRVNTLYGCRDFAGPISASKRRTHYLTSQQSRAIGNLC